MGMRGSVKWGGWRELESFPPSFFDAMALSWGIPMRAEWGGGRGAASIGGRALEGGGKFPVGVKVPENVVWESGASRSIW